MSEEHQNQLSKIVARAWTDEEFKQNLIENPTTILRENGLEVPEGVEIKVVENTDKVVYFTLPPKPKDVDTPESAVEEEEQCASGDCGFMDEENWE